MELIIYLVKSATILSIFYLVYFFFLRKDTLFTAKRFFFILGIIAAVTLPFTEITRVIEVQTPLVSANSQTDFESFTPLQESTAITSIQETKPKFNYWQIGAFLYVVVLAFFLVRFIFRLYSLNSLLKSHTSKRIGNYKYVTIDDNVSPFSIFNYIVFNPTKHSEKELEMILKHEQVHASQWHSVDIILGQLTAILQWANPFSWAYKNSMEENLEYLADSQTVEQIASKKAYQYTLVNATSPITAPALTSPFYRSLIKKRIIMLNKSTTHKRNLLKISLVLPILAFFLWSFNVKEEIVYVLNSSSETEILNNETLVIKSYIEDNELKEISKKLELQAKGIKVEFDKVTRNNNGNITSLVLKTKFEGQQHFVENMTFESSAQSNEIADIFLTFSNNELYYNDTTKQTQFKITKDGVIGLKFPKKEKETSKNNTMGENPLYIINGKQLRKAALPVDTNFEVSESIEMVYPTDAVKKYGEKGKDGVIIFHGITTFNKDIAETETKSLKESKNLVTKTTTLSNSKTTENQKDSNLNKKNTMATIIDFKYHITKNTTDAEFEQMKSELKEKHGTTFNYNVTRNNEGEIITIAIKHTDAAGNIGNYNISGTNPIADIYFYKTPTGQGFSNSSEIKSFGEQQQNMRDRHKSMRKQQRKLREKMYERRDSIFEHRDNLRDNQRRTESNNNTISSTTNRGNTAIISQTTTNNRDEKTYITKDTTDAELEAIKLKLAAKGTVIDFNRLKRNANGEIIRIKINLKDNKGNKQSIVKKSDTDDVIGDVLISQ